MESADEGAPGGVRERASRGQATRGRDQLLVHINASVVAHMQANGSHSHVMEMRMGQAKEQLGSMWQVCEAPELPTGAKLRPYSVGAVAVLTHGCDECAVRALFGHGRRLIGSPVLTGL